MIPSIYFVSYVSPSEGGSIRLILCKVARKKTDPTNVESVKFEKIIISWRTAVRGELP